MQDGEGVVAALRSELASEKQALQTAEQRAKELEREAEAQSQDTAAALLKVASLPSALPRQWGLEFLR